MPQKDNTLSLSEPRVVVPGSPNKNDNSLFVMFTNLKIFRDDSNDSTDENYTINPKINTICDAELDTLEFADSISSTTQGKTTSKSGGYIYKLHKNIKKIAMKKFALKDLTKKHKNKKRITTIKKKLKSNKNKTFFSRRSKKYQHTN